MNTTIFLFFVSFISLIILNLYIINYKIKQNLDANKIRFYNKLYIICIITAIFIILMLVSKEGIKYVS